MFSLEIICFLRKMIFSKGVIKYTSNTGCGDFFFKCLTIFIHEKVSKPSADTFLVLFNFLQIAIMLVFLLKIPVIRFKCAFELTSYTLWVKVPYYYNFKKFSAHKISTIHQNFRGQCPCVRAFSHVCKFLLSIILQFL